ncbi:hypothetical protein GCM10007863_34160 [Dyella mobilis]|nr:hypothetical protein GCM10007863_34160 [Dyella mobilis]
MLTSAILLATAILRMLGCVRLPLQTTPEISPGLTVGDVVGRTVREAGDASIRLHGTLSLMIYVSPGYG